jgi:ribosomal protein S18 acetylase RimI-like enzyme
VRSILRAIPDDCGLGGIRLDEEAVATPYAKDYGESGDAPSLWPSMAGVSRWGFFLAGSGEHPVGGAAVGVGDALLPVGLPGPPGLAVLWDIRVAPDARGRGIGSALMLSVAAWARAHGGTRLAAETQNVNVPACRFYVRQGFTLGAVHRFGYAGIPPVASEVLLLWYLDL